MKDRYVMNYARLAELAGVSKATVSLALRNHPKISKQTRERIQELARKHNYSVNPLLAAQMAYVKRGKLQKSSATVLGLIAPKTLIEARKDMQTPLQYYHAGISERAMQLGFKVDYIPLMSGDIKNKRLNGILAARGIKGIIFAPLTEDYPLAEFDFNWDDYATVAIEHTFDTPRIHSVCNDEMEAFRRLVIRLKKIGINRIGIAMMELEDLHVKHHWLAGYLSYNYLTSGAPTVDPFITRDWSKQTFLKWFNREKPDAIICIDDTVYNWLEEEGIRVPDDVSIASLYWLPSRSWMSGFYQNHEAMGAAAVDLLTGLLYRNEYGLPEEPKKVLIQSVWKQGHTLPIDAG